ncbi:hypothetical protein ACUODJ_58675, partial [Escherichia sp. HC-CC]
MKVKTWEGEKWLNLDGEERFINKSFYAYNEPSHVLTFNHPLGVPSTTLKFCGLYNAPAFALAALNKSFYAYNEASF